MASEPIQPAPVPAPQRWQVEPAEADVRLDALLAGRLKLSRAQVRRLLEEGLVSVGGRRMGASDKGLLLAAGAVVQVEPFVGPQGQRALPQPELKVPVLAAGEGWVIVDKPAGMPVHPLKPSETGTVLNAVMAQFPEMHSVGEGGLRSGVVHRLDTDTSGTLALATTQARWEELRRAFAEHRARKVYRAIVRGRLEGRGREVLDLVIAQHRPAKVRVVGEPMEQTGVWQPEGVRRCDLAWRAVEMFERVGGATLLEIELGTGFLHQIRVTLAHRGHAVLGDLVYGEGRDPIAVPRVMLHAARLELGAIGAVSPDPADFVEVVGRLRE